MIFYWGEGSLILLGRHLPHGCKHIAQLPRLLCVPTLLMVNLSVCLSLDTLSNSVACCSQVMKPHTFRITSLMLAVGCLSLLTFLVTLWPLLRPMAMGKCRAMAAALRWQPGQEAKNSKSIK